MMEQEFYFVRHGQTDFNRKDLKHDLSIIDHVDIALNSHGENQAKEIEPLIATLPIKTICHSPLKRVIQTKQLIAPRLTSAHIALPELKECPIRVWLEICHLKDPSLMTPASLSFKEQTKSALEQVLRASSPALIIAHAGIHWMLCHLLNIQQHEWVIGNCVPVHFIKKSGQWSARKL